MNIYVRETYNSVNGLANIQIADDKNEVSNEQSSTHQIHQRCNEGGSG